MKVLVFTAAGLQTAYLGCYGNDWIETPGLDALAAEGVVFDQHLADHPDAAGARRSWRSGRYTFPSAEDSKSVAPPLEDLLDVLREGKVSTCLVRCSGSPLPEFASGWWKVTEVHAESMGHADPEPLLEAIASGLEELGESDQWLMWVELGSLLPPWYAHPDHQE